jgi:hypothetical protein
MSARQPRPDGVYSVYTIEGAKMTDEQTRQNEPDEIARLITAGASPGIEAALQHLEGVERAYYGAVLATTVPEAVTASATTPFPVEAHPAS